MQSRRLQTLFKSVSFANVLTSSRQRARQTCSLAGLANESEIEPDLAEWDYGAYEGLSTAEIRKTAPAWNIFRDGCPGGETAAQVSARADRLIARLSPMGGDIALFSHGQFGCVQASRWIGLAVIEGQHFALDTASLSILGPKSPFQNSWRRGIPPLILSGKRSKSVNPVRRRRPLRGINGRRRQFRNGL